MITINALFKSIAMAIFILFLILIYFICKIQFINNTLIISIYNPFILLIESVFVLSSIILFWNLEKIYNYLTS
jgi:hypothetical protein